MHSAEQDASDLIPHVEAPLNVFRTQIVFRIGKELRSQENPHPGYIRHYVTLEEIGKSNLISILKQCLNPAVINGIKIPETYLPLLQEVYLQNFIFYKVRITQRLVEDVSNEDRVCAIIENEHKRAHRNPRENREQILERYYFPKMASTIKKYTTFCEICKLNKYDRHPPTPPIKDTPVPKYPCEIVHVDILEIRGEKFLSCLDKFSKFAKLFHIKNKSSPLLRVKFAKILHYFTVPKILVTDNEKSFLSPLVSNYIKGLGIELYQTPIQRSEVNGQVERLHSTLIEIYRCLLKEIGNGTVKELLYTAVDRYNNTIHSITKRKPSDIFFNRTQRINYQGLTDFKSRVHKEIAAQIKKNQEIRNLRLNKGRKEARKFTQGETVYVKNKQIKGKHKALYGKATIGKDNRVTVQTQEGRKIHKIQIKT